MNNRDTRTRRGGGAPLAAGAALVGSPAVLFTIMAMILFSVLALTLGSAQAADGSTIDFDSGLGEGDEPTSLTSGSGISGTVVAGSVGLSGTGLQGFDSMIFGASCGGIGVCSGGDSDLELPSQFNVLILSEDGNDRDSNDDAGGGVITFDFSTLAARRGDRRDVANHRQRRGRRDGPDVRCGQRPDRHSPPRLMAAAW